MALLSDGARATRQRWISSTGWSGTEPTGHRLNLIVRVSDWLSIDGCPWHQPAQSNSTVIRYQRADQKEWGRPVAAQPQVSISLPL